MVLQFFWKILHDPPTHIFLMLMVTMENKQEY